MQSSPEPPPEELKAILTHIAVYRTIINGTHMIILRTVLIVLVITSNYKHVQMNETRFTAALPRRS